MYLTQIPKTSWLLPINMPFNIRHLLPTTPTRLHGIIAIFLQEGCSVVPSCMRN